MAVNVLITGGSGYLGGSLLDLLSRNKPLPNCGTIFALVRSQEQAKKTKEFYRCTPTILNLSDEAEVTRYLLEKKISVVFHLIDSRNSDTQVVLIKALGAVGKELGVTTHFLHTTGAKIFSGFADHPTDRAISDTEDGLAAMQANAQPELAPMRSVGYPCFPLE